MSNTPPLIFPEQQQPPPVGLVTEQAYTAHSGHGSVGPVIAVLAVIAILGAIAVMIGRLCSGRRVLGRAQYDFEGWVEAKCSSCLDGRVDPPRPRAVMAETSSGAMSGNTAPVAITAETPQETAKEEEEEEEITQQHDPHERAEL